MPKLKLVTSAALVALTITLSACGGGSSDGNGGLIVSPGTVSPVADSFFTAVLALIGTSPDNTEPTDITAVAATSPDNTEPVAGPF